MIEQVLMCTNIDAEGSIVVAGQLREEADTAKVRDILEQHGIK